MHDRSIHGWMGRSIIGVGVERRLETCLFSAVIGRKKKRNVELSILLFSYFVFKN